MKKSVTVVGAGLAGAEAAWQIANKGVLVQLIEMKPEKKTPAHQYKGFGELVCSNSLRADRLENAVGLLKEEMRRLDSLVLAAADATRVPAGGALAVDRYAFSDYMTKRLAEHPAIQIAHREVTDLEELEGLTVIATGPLTTDALADSILKKTGQETLHFFDAAAPIVTGESVDMDKAFWASRYERGKDYLNCPMTKEEYARFLRALLEAECVEAHGFEEGNVFEGCMPVEVMAGRGEQTLLFGPLKPVGLTNPHTGQEPYAVVQLRKVDREGRLFNLVGFQTHLKWPEQKRVFSLIPGLEQAEFVRFGVMHRNTYLKSPGLLDACYRLIKDPRFFLPGR